MQDVLWPRADWVAVKAVYEGTADAAMQRRAVMFIVQALGMVDAQTFVPGNPDMTAFNEGRRWVARQIHLALTKEPKHIVAPEDMNAGVSSSDHDRSAVNAARSHVERVRSRQRAARNLIDAAD